MQKENLIVYKGWSLRLRSESDNICIKPSPSLIRMSLMVARSRFTKKWKLNSVSLCNFLDTLPLKPLFHKTNLHFSQSLSFYNFPSNFNFKRKLKSSSCSSQCCIKASSNGHAATFEIDMVRNKQGVYTHKGKKNNIKVIVLWDLDNKPPRGHLYDAAMSLRRIAEKFGKVADISAYANRHAFIHLLQWVIEESRDRKTLDILKRTGVFVPSDPYICRVCGRKCKSNHDPKKHFKQ